MATDTDILQEARDVWEDCLSTHNENRQNAVDDLRFGRVGDQWPADVRQMRRNRPMLTINRCPTSIRQVINDIRQNTPRIHVKPVDFGADDKTAEVFKGIIRHIETRSFASIAYDTAAEYAASANCGYVGLMTEYAHDDTFDMDLRIRTFENVSAVLPDPYDQSIDGSGWNVCFVTDTMPRAEFEELYPNAEPSSWDAPGFNEQRVDNDQIVTAEQWLRRPKPRKICLLSNGDVIADDLYRKMQDAYAIDGITKVDERSVRSYEVRQRILSGGDVLEDRKWVGTSIPIVPVYGDRVNIEGKVYLMSMIYHAKDAQRAYNYWRTITTETVALQPKAPYVGFTGQFDTGRQKWETAHAQNHVFLEADGFEEGMPLPQRQPPVGLQAGMVQEGLSAADDFKQTMGMFDASIGDRSNEVTGVAQTERRKTTNLGTFHIADNLARAMTCLGKQIVEAIPYVYPPGRLVRVIGEDGKTSDIRTGSAEQVQEAQAAAGSEDAQGALQVYDLTTGKYDVEVDIGPGYTTRRDEASEKLMQLITAIPQAAPLLADLLVDLNDWPQKDKVIERLQALLPEGPDEQTQMQMAQMQEAIAILQAELQDARADQQNKAAQNAIKRAEMEIKLEDARTRRAQAETQRVSEGIPETFTDIPPISTPGGNGGLGDM